MSFRDQPALAQSPDGPPAGRQVDGGMREVMVRFLDGSSRLVRLLEWRRTDAGWWCLLRWGVSGQLTKGWYLSDPKLMEPLGEPRT